VEKTTLGDGIVKMFGGLLRWTLTELGDGCRLFGGGLARRKGWLNRQNSVESLTDEDASFLG